MVSSRSDTAVTEAVNRLRAQGYTAHGTTCHVGHPEEIIALMEKVRGSHHGHYYNFITEF